MNLHLTGRIARRRGDLDCLRDPSCLASISGSFLGAKLSHGSLDVWAVLALVAFVMSLGSAIWVLLPHSLVFAFRGEALLGISDQEGVEDVGQAYRAAGIWIEPYLDYNRDKIAQLPAWFTASCVRSGTKEIEQASPERVGELVGHAVKPVET